MSKRLRTLCITFTAVCALTACQKTPEQIAQEQAIQKEHTTLVADLIQISKDECVTAPTSQLQKALSDLDNEDLRIFKNNKLTICIDPRLDAQKGMGRNIYGVYYNATAKKVVSINSDKDGDIDYAYSILNKLPSVVIDKKDNENYYAGRFSSGKSRYTRWRDEGRFGSALSSNPQLKEPPLKPAVKADGPQW